MEQACVTSVYFVTLLSSGKETVIPLLIHISSEDSEARQNA